MKNKTLILVKMGCDFFANDCRESDIGNYRVETRGGLVSGKDGRKYFLSFSHCERYETRTANKRTGKPLKNPVRELRNNNGLHVDTEYDDENGSWRNCKLESELWNMDLPYSKIGILQAVNHISADHYSEVEIIDVSKIYKIGGFREREIIGAKEKRISVVMDSNGYKVFRFSAECGSFDYEANSNRIVG